LSGVVYKEPAKEAKAITDFNLRAYIDGLVNLNWALPPVVKKTQYSGEIEWVKMAYSQGRWNAMVFLYASPDYYFTSQAFPTANNIIPSYIDKNTILLKMVFNNVPDGMTVGSPDDVPEASPCNEETPVSSPNKGTSDLHVVIGVAQ
jgi:hypothetical protein